MQQLILIYSFGSALQSSHFLPASKDPTHRVIHTAAHALLKMSESLKHDSDADRLEKSELHLVGLTLFSLQYI
jgi:hypothetical protein